ncbi:ABC transporter permease [Photobacterium sp.]|uniref:PhnE/PtxC family ABC transporter permease n=1 Tax=Photobacterium sp. TaxID=660 RepID=UPI00299F34A3|nr:ABC transporter permease [Photobacterium sp.]MDX1300845.1 ABC transporter permease [Photobacterium sp.]
MMQSSGHARGKLSFIFILIALALTLTADLEISTLDPWTEMGRMFTGLVTPDFFATEYLFDALLFTLSIALLGITFGAFFGFFLALVFTHRPVRILCAFFRSIHELFWALIFLQIFGLTPLTALCAISIPYTCTFAKVYAEIFEQADNTPALTVSRTADVLSVFIYTKLALVRDQLFSYTRYRFECALRSSTILGFVGLPTLGFHLESAFSQGNYSQAGALLLLFYLLIVSINVWLKIRFLPAYIAAAWLYLPEFGHINWDNVARFFGSDIWPGPLRHATEIDLQVATETLHWYWSLLTGDFYEGLINTLILSHLALVATGVITLIAFPLAVKLFVGFAGRMVGQGILVVLRSTPEMILAFIFLLLLGPSMLPAVLALAIHNGGLIAFLIAELANTLQLRPDAPLQHHGVHRGKVNRGQAISLYLYEVLPRIYSSFLAFIFYRWEVIMRETAILGVLGVTTLGFYIDSAFEDMRFDRAISYIVISALLCIGIDTLSRHIRQQLNIRV